MKVALGADHAGYELKEKVKKYLSSKGVETIDMGTNSTESVDYPDFATQVALMVSKREADWGVLVCKSGIGMSIAANKIAGVRAALSHTVEDAQLARGHNDANVLALSGAFTTEEEAKKIIDTWLETKFEGGRHERRVSKIKNLEDKS
ncbi:MAG: ribose 5-phosphate isomerase B [candidate division Zixibacteria bacterium RBG_16_50_21]|nr:MAG: ribose 5-phosphate isomerase B [candidate division Zixibacteria bacterium RBG_16_50_21]